MSQENHENDPFSLENESWANLCDDSSDNSGGDKAVSVPQTREDDKGKKRRRETTRKTKGEVENGKKKKKGGEDHEIHIWTERERRKKMRNMFSNLHTLLPHIPLKADKSTIVSEAINYIKTLQSTLQRLHKQKLERFQAGGPSNRLTPEPSIAATSMLAMLSTRETFMADQISSMNVDKNNHHNNNNSNANNSNTTFSACRSHLPVSIQTWTSSNVVLNICGNDAQFAVYVPKKLGLFTALCCVIEKHKLEVVSAHVLSDVDRCVYMIQARVVDRACDQFTGLMSVEEIYKQAAGEMMLWISS